MEQREGRGMAGFTGVVRKRQRKQERGEAECAAVEGREGICELGYSFYIKGEGSLPGLCGEPGILPLPTGRTTTREE